MALRKRNGVYHLDFRPFKEKKIGLKLSNVGKVEAKRIESVILTACRSGDYSGLDPVSREACIRMFENQGWELPPDLGGTEKPKEELTFWKACELFLKDPEIRDHPGRWRYEDCLDHLVDKLREETPLKSIWVTALKQYRKDRENEGAAPATINHEMAALSKLFSIMVEHQHVEVNPVRLLKRLSTKSGERQVYLSRETVQTIAGKCPAWFRPLIWTAYYTGMRRGEILGLTRKRVNLPKRMIYLGPDDTKEGHWKLVPIHSELVPILAQVLQGPALISGKVFPLSDADGLRELGLETFKNPWERACKALQAEEQEKKVETLKWEKPWPRFHDLRHTWRTNARRSGVDRDIAESILGHWNRALSVNERYGRINDEELLQAIDKITFDHGETEILVGSREKKVTPKNGDCMATGRGSQRKRSRGYVT